MKRIELSVPAKLILTLALAWILSTGIDPYVSLSSPLAVQAVNAVVPTILVLLFWGLTGRAWLALVIEVVLLYALRYSDHMKVKFLDTDIVYADFTVIGGLLKDPQLILGFLHPSPLKIVGVVVAVGAAVGIWWLSRRHQRASWPFRAGCIILAVSACAVIWTHRAPDVIHPLRWEVFQQVVGAQRVGIAGNILLGRMTARDVQRAPDRAAEAAFWKEPLVQKAAQQVVKQGNGRKPDIVIIQSESLFEPSQLCGFADEPVLQRVAQEKPSLPGNLRVPVFGGRTLQTEFETLTGAPISFYPGSMFAYYELVNHRFDALPHVLDQMGYRTLAIHPNKRGFWRRDVAMPDMGFGSFQDIGSFVYPRDFSERGHVTDAALTRAILAELDSSDRPMFITAISMDNHGPWGDFPPRDDSQLGLPDKLKGEGRTQLADYVVHAIDADHAYGFLLDALQRRGRPTVVLFYGDHLPALPPVYDQLCFKDGKPPQKHMPPYRVWANFPVPPPPDVTSSYLTQGWLMHISGLPLKGHVLANALAGLATHDPAASEADRKRILAEYANIAADNVRTVVPSSRKASTVFVGRDQAIGMLMGRESTKQASGKSTLRYNDLYMESRGGKPAQVDFHVGGALASITLRPYLGTRPARCLAHPAATGAKISVTGDGRELYRATLAPKTFRLATLDLRGIKQLTVRAVEDDGAVGCAPVYLRVAQMLCYSPTCTTPGPALAESERAASRILTSDPVEGDIERLDSLLPERRKHIDQKMTNIQTMMGREKSKQIGYAPFQVNPDAQLFMHPADDHSAWIEFDVSDLGELEFSPRINKLNDQCKKMNTPGKEAGVVGLTISLDGKPVVPRFLVDRNYDGKLTVPVRSGHSLRVEVDKGNEVAWCDWFSIGVTRLDGQAPEAP